jgi:hypothetical integral membrane protein (TIGR02206 family)
VNAPPASIAGPAPLPAWLTEFHAFGWLHALLVVLAVAATVGLCRLGIRARSSGREWEVRTGWVVFVALWQLFGVVYWLLPANIDVRTSLPLQLCDLAGLLAPVALVALLYFWAIGLSTQAFFTPIVEVGPARAHFWIFWLGHFQIVASAVYDCWVLGYRPRFRDYISVFAVNLGLLVVWLGVNGALGANYGYVGRSTPGSRTIVDALGPWPGRILWIAVIAQGAQLLAWLPWALAGRRRAGRGPIVLRPPAGGGR